jgi:hypothetical protein
VAVRRALNDLLAFLDMARHHTEHVRVLLHPELPELCGKIHPGRSQIAALARELSIPVSFPDARYREAPGEGASLYLDVIHPSDTGQALLAQLLQEEVLQSLAPSP